MMARVHPMPTNRPDREEWRLLDAERPVRLALGYSALIFLPVIVLLLVMATKFTGLTAPAGWEQAQLGRHLAAGDGYVTSSVRPLALAHHSRRGAQPELLQAPGPPLVLAAVFVGAPVSDRTVAATGLVIWVVTVWLTFALARRWLTGKAAALAAIFYGGTVAPLAAATAGEPVALLSLLLLVTLGLASSLFREEQTGNGRVFLAGVSCAVAGLTEFSVGVVVLVVAGYLLTTQRQNFRTLVWFGLGFALPWLPWLWWNWRQTGGVLGLVPFQFLTNTQTFPGDSIWRTLDPPSPFWFVVGHPLEMLRKLFTGLGQFVSQLPAKLNPVVVVLFVVALPAAVRNPKLRALALLTVTGLAASVVLNCLLQPAPQLLSAWAPLLAILAAGPVTEWIESRTGRVNLHWLKITPPPAPPVTRSRPQKLWRELLGTRYWGQGLALVAVAGAAVVPLLYFLLVNRPGPAPWPRGVVLPAEAVVVTDQPAAVSWYTGRCAVWLWSREADWDRIEKLGFVPTVAVVSSALASAGNWWSWLAAPRGIYRGLAPAGMLPGSFVYRQRRDAGGPAELPAATTADHHLRRGTILLANDRLREAWEEFQKAGALDPDSLDAVLGLWQTQAQLHDAGDVLGMARRVLQPGARTAAAPALVEDLARVLTQAAAARPHDPWLLLMLATCEARLERFDAVRARCERLASFAPKTLPVELLLGALYLQQQRVAEAAAAVEPVASRLPGNVAVQELLGQIRGAQGRWEEALQCYRTAQRLRPERLRPYLEAGFIALRQRNGTEAAGYFEAGARLEPKSLAVRTGLAEALTLQGKTGEAVVIYRELAAEFPREPALLNNLAHLLANTGQDAEEAIRVARQAVELAPRQAGVRDTLGWAYLRAGQPVAAMEQLQEAARLDPNTGIIRYHLGKALLAAGRRADAETALRAALSQGLPAEESADAQKILGGR
jgi:tetratricopeptide (TPR) repeat protein